MEWLIFLSIAAVVSTVGAYFVKKTKARERADLEAETFTCEFNPTMDMYASEMPRMHIWHLSRNAEIYKDGVNSGVSGCSSNATIVANDVDKLKEYLSEIITKKIIQPDYPRYVKFVWIGLPDKFCLVDDGQVVKTENVIAIEKVHSDYYYVRFRTNDDIVRKLTMFESPEEYEARLSSEAVEEQERRCAELLDKLQIVQSYQPSGDKRVQKHCSVDDYGSIQAAIAANAGKIPYHRWN
jgi:hypothetical protein